MRPLVRNMKTPPTNVEGVFGPTIAKCQVTFSLPPGDPNLGPSGGTT